MEGGVILDVLLDILPVELGDQAIDILFVLELLGIRRLRFDGANLSAERGDVEEVASATAILPKRSVQVIRAKQHATYS